LIWNWEVNYDHYPGWQQMVDSWRTEMDTRVLTYISPFFSNPTNFTSSNSLRHNFYSEGMQNGYFVKHPDGSVYTLFSLSIEFAMVDLTNPSAWNWMKNIIINQSIVEAKSSGWMCDFGEYLPFDSVLYSVRGLSWNLQLLLQFIFREKVQRLFITCIHKFGENLRKKQFQIIIWPITLRRQKTKYFFL
jgi:alpha-glucosidase (family GH31 glycosyl hydrolase)